MSFLTQSYKVFFRASSLSNSSNFPRYTTSDPVIIILSFNMSKPSQPTRQLISWTIGVLTALSAQTSYIVPQEYEIYHVGPGDKTNTS